MHCPSHKPARADVLCFSPLSVIADGVTESAFLSYSLFPKRNYLPKKLLFNNMQTFFQFLFMVPYKYISFDFVTLLSFSALLLIYLHFCFSRIWKRLDFIIKKYHNSSDSLSPTITASSSVRFRGLMYMVFSWGMLPIKIPFSFIFTAVSSALPFCFNSQNRRG